MAFDARQAVLILMMFVLGACAPAQHVHVTLAPDVDPPALEAVVSDCLDRQGFQLSRPAAVSLDRLETCWISDQASVEIVFFPGGGWIDVIGFTGRSRREALALQAAQCLESSAEGITTEPQSHGRFVWGFGC